jgi:hypothetical protein
MGIACSCVLSNCGAHSGDQVEMVPYERKPIHKTTIYALKLEHDKWYVGKTTKSVKDRFEEHRNERGSAWTKLHKPLSYEIISKNASPFDEDKCTEEYMNLYGIDNVRGGVYSGVHLESEVHKQIQKKIWHANDACLRCGRTSHFVAGCYAKKDVNGTPLESISKIEVDNDDFDFTSTAKM